MGSNLGPAPSSSASNRWGAPNFLFRNVPTPFELEEFFTHEEQALQRLFTEKHNFDFVDELPLPGRYEWVKVSPSGNSVVGGKVVMSDTFLEYSIVRGMKA